MKSHRMAVAMLAATGAAAFPVPSGAYTLRESESGAVVRWHEANRSVRVDDSLTQLGPAGQARAAVGDALTAWGSVAGSPFDFNLEDGFRGGLGTGQRLDGISDVCMVDHDWQFDQSFLAITLVTYDAVTGEIWDADVLLNADKHRFGFGESAAGQYDAASVVTHEVGHLVGLGHSEVGEATMYAYSHPRETDKRSLAPDDEQGLAALYMGQAMDGAASCSIGGGPAYGPTSSCWIALGAGAGLLFRGRGRRRRRKTQ